MYVSGRSPTGNNIRLLSSISQILASKSSFPRNNIRVMAAQERSKKTSVTQLVHSTIGGFGLVTAEPNSPSATLSSPEEAMASRLQFNAKTSAGSVSSDKVATSENDLGMSSLDKGPRPTRGRLLPQPSQEK